MQFLEVLRRYLRLLSRLQYRDDLVMIALSLFLALGVTLIWMRDSKPLPAPVQPDIPAVSRVEPPVFSRAGKDGVVPPPSSVTTSSPASVPDRPDDGLKLIAIVMDDMGPNREATDRAMKLPAAVTFAFLPYAPDVAALAKQARAAGHEILVHVPMQPEGPADPGPHALRTDQTPEALRTELIWNLSRFTGYSGINNHMGSRLTADEAAMRVVMDELKARGLMLLDSRTTKNTRAALIAEETGVPVLSRDVFLDNYESGNEVKSELEKLEHIAGKKGSAIAIGHPHATTLDELKKWMPSLEKRGYRLVPLTELLKHSQKN